MNNLREYLNLSMGARVHISRQGVEFPTWAPALVVLPFRLLQDGLNDPFS